MGEFMHARRHRRSSTGSILARCVVSGLVLVVAATACGGDDGGGDGPSATAAENGDDTAPASDGGAADVSGECAGTDLTVTDVASGESFQLTSAVAHSGHAGAIYVTYAADYEIGEDDLGSFFPEVSEGENVAVIQLTSFGSAADLEPLEPGTEIEVVFGLPQGLTFLVAYLTGDERHDSASEADTTGRMEVTAVGGAFCAEIDYVDADKELSGTIEAPVTRIR
jgi:hypothetical protein